MRPEEGVSTEWRTDNEDARKLHNIHKRPHMTGTKLYQNTKNRKHLVWITRLRTGHYSLNNISTVSTKRTSRHANAEKAKNRSSIIHYDTNGSIKNKKSIKENGRGRNKNRKTTRRPETDKVYDKID